jgi:thiol-disulfide isomerase/thioredoxin
MIKVGIANISGSISNLKLPEGEKRVLISFSAYNPVSGEESKYTANLDENNWFNIDIPLECSTAIIGFNVQSETRFWGYAVVGLDQHKNLQLNIIFDEKGNMKIDTEGGIQLSSDDLINIPKAIERFETYYTWADYYKMTPNEFTEYELNVSLKKRIRFALDSLSLSNNIQKYLANTFNLRYFDGRIFDYNNVVEKSFNVVNKNSAIHNTATELTPSFYSFLKNYNLNDPQYLYCYSYSSFIKAFLSVKAFNIPDINDLPINEWLFVVKDKITNVVGFDSGLFYDMLVANSFSLQMNYKMKPLTDKQKENIQNYFASKNKEFADVLLKNNDEIIKTLERSSDLKINATPSISKEKLMETIISKYKGKVVLVDFWATWCGPCKSGIKDMESLRQELKSKDIVFVYISNVSSPKDRWNTQIKAIGGEQYYLESSEWDYISDNYSFDGIPSYLIYDKDGKLKHKFTGFPGVDKMREMINELLP